MQYGRNRKTSILECNSLKYCLTLAFEQPQENSYTKIWGVNSSCHTNFGPKNTMFYIYQRDAANTWTLPLIFTSSLEGHNSPFIRFNVCILIVHGYTGCKSRQHKRVNDCYPLVDIMIITQLNLNLRLVFLSHPLVFKIGCWHLNNTFFDGLRYNVLSLILCVLITHY